MLGLKVKPSSPQKENNLFSLFVLLSMLSIHTNIYRIDWTNKVLISSRQKNVAVQVDSHPLLHGCRQFWSCSPFTCSWEEKLDGVEILAGEPLNTSSNQQTLIRIGEEVRGFQFLLKIIETYKISILLKEACTGGAHPSPVQLWQLHFKVS